MRRRSFIAGSLAALAFPQALLAQNAAYDPTPQLVSVKKHYSTGQLLILPRSHYLYLVTAPGQAMRYGVGVGKAGLEFTGTATIDVKKEGSIRISYAHGPTGRIPTAAARTARGVGCLGSTAR